MSTQINPALSRDISDSGRIRFTADHANENYYIDAEEGYSPVAMRTLLDDLSAQGYGVMDDSEAPFDVLTVNGVNVVRGYLALIRGSEAA